MRMGWLGCAALTAMAMVAVGGCGGDDDGGGGGGGSSGSGGGGSSECKPTDGTCYVAGGMALDATPG